MKEKAAFHTARMKEQTIGVEVEMNNITRQKAAKTATKFFGTHRYIYTGEADEYFTWSAWDALGREWKFQLDPSIHAEIDFEKCELVTPILYYKDIETLQGLLTALKAAGAKSCASRGCGVHIHIGLGDHNAHTLTNLANIMAAHEEQIGRAIKIDESRTEDYCRTVDHVFLKRLNAEKPVTMEQLADIWYQGNNADYSRNAHYNLRRYHMLNLHAVFTKGTIEFRLFQFNEDSEEHEGGINCDQMKAYIQLCLAMSALAKELKYASPKPQQRENEKYAFRCWMLRLGFIGKEFKTARKILLENMSGNGAWR